MGIAKAALATVISQIADAIITCWKGFAIPPVLKTIPAYVRQIYQAGIPDIIMNALGRVYIVALNFILSSFRMKPSRY